MQISDLIGSDMIVPNLHVSSKKQALQELSKKMASMTELEERAIFDVLLERERLGTTGVGNGVAIPHGRFKDISKLYGLFAKLDKPINFDAIDEQPVDLIFLLLAPESAGADHLKALAQVSRMMRNKDICSKMRGIKDKEALFALFLNQEKLDEEDADE